MSLKIVVVTMSILRLNLKQKHYVALITLCLVVWLVVGRH